MCSARRIRPENSTITIKKCINSWLKEPSASRSPLAQRGECMKGISTSFLSKSSLRAWSEKLTVSHRSSSVNTRHAGSDETEEAHCEATHQSPRDKESKLWLKSQNCGLVVHDRAVGPVRCGNTASGSYFFIFKD